MQTPVEAVNNSKGTRQGTPIVLQTLRQFYELEFYLPLALMLQDAVIRLADTRRPLCFVPVVLRIPRVGPNVKRIALHMTRCT